ncbi:MAG: hypothetical protein M3433_03850 [Actinomycetota bacterium]|nr:hypothetical protein [Actinomycetota bacterium]
MALIAGAAIALVFVMSGDDEATPTAKTAVRAATARYDGGPEEGTRGLVRPDAARALRYDGGPEEGNRGALSPNAVPGTRYDGGPDEGSRGMPSTSAPSSAAAGVRFRGGIARAGPI